MGKTTLRDKVWRETLARTIKAGRAVQPPEIAEITGASERMTRQCLLSIKDAGWIELRAADNGEVRYVPSRNVEWAEERQ